MELAMVCGIVCLWMSIGVASVTILRYLQKDVLTLSDVLVYSCCGILSLVIVLAKLISMYKNKIFLNFKK